MGVSIAAYDVVGAATFIFVRSFRCTIQCNSTMSGWIIRHHTFTLWPLIVSNANRLLRLGLPLSMRPAAS